MPHNLDMLNEDYGITDNTDAPAHSGSDVEPALAEITRILTQMLFLAELSAGDYDVDRSVLQKELEHLQAKIDRIADTI